MQHLNNLINYTRKGKVTRGSSH